MCGEGCDAYKMDAKKISITEASWGPPRGKVSKIYFKFHENILLTKENFLLRIYLQSFIAPTLTQLDLMACHQLPPLKLHTISLFLVLQSATMITATHT